MTDIKYKNNISGEGDNTLYSFRNPVGLFDMD